MICWTNVSKSALCNTFKATEMGLPKYKLSTALKVIDPILLCTAAHCFGMKLAEPQPPAKKTKNFCLLATIT